MKNTSSVPTLVFATNNAHKLSEIRAIFGDKLHILSLADIDCHDDIPETADTLEGNALIKARWVKERYGFDCFADDTGLEVSALGGCPGVHTARYAYPDREEHLFEGIVRGQIATEKRGTEGFGYDPVFAPEGEGGKTFAELGVDVKNHISHRARAVAKLAAFLNK